MARYGTLGNSSSFYLGNSIAWEIHCIQCVIQESPVQTQMAWFDELCLVQAKSGSYSLQ